MTDRGATRAQAERAAAARVRTLAEREHHLAFLYGGPLQERRLDVARQLSAEAERHEHRASEIDGTACRAPDSVPDEELDDVIVLEPLPGPPEPSCPAPLLPKERAEQEWERAVRARDLEAKYRHRAEAGGPLASLHRSAAEVHRRAFETHQRVAERLSAMADRAATDST